MKVNKSKNGTALYVSVEGRIDTSTSRQFEAEVKSSLNGMTELDIDFSQLDYISSAGLRVLLSLQKIMNTQGSMRIIGVNETISEILEITGFSEILNII